MKAKEPLFNSWSRHLIFLLQIFMNPGHPDAIGLCDQRPDRREYLIRMSTNTYVSIQEFPRDIVPTAAMWFGFSTRLIIQVQPEL
jgi:hypothetical protein